MRAVWPLLAVLGFLSLSLFAGEYLMNEETAYGLRVTFTEPVTLTHFGDVLMTVSPEGESTEFVFSGAELPAWVGHGLAWKPATARLASYDWLTETPPCFGVLQAASDSEPEKSNIEVILTSPSGSAASIALARETTRKTIPIRVKYSIQQVPEGISGFAWNVSQGDPGLHYEPFPAAVEQGEDGWSVEIVMFSNRQPYTIELTASDSEGQMLQWSDLLEVELLAGESIRLAPLPAMRQLSWSQRSLASDSLLYASGNEVRIEEMSDGAALCYPYPGNYLLSGTAEDGASLDVEVFVTGSGGRSLSVRGVFLADYYGIYPWGCITKDTVIESVEYAAELNANVLGVNNFTGALQYHPLPLLRIDEGGASLSMSRLEELAEQCDLRDMDVYLSLAVFNLYPYLSLEEQESFWRGDLKDRGWYEAWFGQQLGFARYNLSVAQGFNIEYLSLFEHAGPLYLDDNYEKLDLGGLCQTVVGDLRGMFAGAVGWADPHAGNSNEHLEGVDFVVARMWTQEHFRTSTFADYRSPTMPEIRAATRERLEGLGHVLSSGVTASHHPVADQAASCSTNAGSCSVCSLATLLASPAVVCAFSNAPTDM